jgi:hypothetical protein
MSLRKAINAKCKKCIYDSIGGSRSWCDQAANCTSRLSPLYENRPNPSARLSEKRSSIVAREDARFGGLNGINGGNS